MILVFVELLLLVILLVGDMSHSLIFVSNHSVEEATNRVFQFYNIYVLSRLKKIVHLFDLNGNFITVRCGSRISCNHVKQYGCSNNPSRRKTSSIKCGCDWVIIFKFLTSQKYRASDSIEIIQVCGRCTNTCDPSFTDQYVVAIIHSAEYKKITHTFLQKIYIKYILIRKLVLGL